MQALLRHVMGRQWRRQLDGKPLAAAAPAVAALLAWFWDRPGLDAHPFSIHSLCEAGRAHGCRPMQALLQGKFSPCVHAACRAMAGTHEQHLLACPAVLRITVSAVGVDSG